MNSTAMELEVDDENSIYAIFKLIEQSSVITWLRQNFPYLLPLLCIVGIVGNSMALLLIRTNFWLRRLTSNVYLCTLSISSCVFLFTLIVSWVDSMYRLHIYMDSEIGCKLFTFLAHLSDFICVWMISWISCDRMVVLYRPAFRKWVCTKRFARNWMICTLLTSILFYSWVFMFAGLEEYKDDQFCGLSSKAQVFGYPVADHYFLFTLLDTAICTLLPAILIMFVNSLSIYRYRQCMRIYSSGVLRVRFDRSSNGNPIPYEETTAKKLLLSQTHTNTHTSTQSNRSACGKLRSSDLQLSRTLLIVTSTFVLLNVPSYMVRIIQYIFEPQTQIFHFLHYFSYLIYYLHHAVLFYMYIFWSPQMKKQLKPTAIRLLECYCFKTVPEFGHRSTSLQAFN
ncbi:hypothetical protein Y032_0500g2582 [Ancylostoma ceylanicum]|uniref:G-protein coupled receptors family 1 profile domain-containing protein n=1 Tax=Ancylostoma ceylanicum TaxID=53326 RepID=A0A016WU60_9BILA|nr:hypothetical protein Y032_0500g2582 [Ancylostoma ceylanicum]